MKAEREKLRMRNKSVFLFVCFNRRLLFADSEAGIYVPAAIMVPSIIIGMRRQHATHSLNFSFLLDAVSSKKKKEMLKKQSLEKYIGEKTWENLEKFMILAS